MPPVKVRIKVLVANGLEWEETKRDGLPNWLCWDTTRKFYIGNTIKKHTDKLKKQLRPFSVYTKEIEI